LRRQSRHRALHGVAAAAQISFGVKIRCVVAARFRGRSTAHGGAHCAPLAGGTLLRIALASSLGGGGNGGNALSGAHRIGGLLAAGGWRSASWLVGIG